LSHSPSSAKALPFVSASEKEHPKGPPSLVKEREMREAAAATVAAALSGVLGLQEEPRRRKGRSLGSDRTRL